ncbi:MAG: hypothetical protein AB1743_05090 [Actinomycetota bacterium]
MASAEKSVDLATAKRYIKGREIKGYEGCSIARAYFKETYFSAENAEIDSKGLYSFEKLIRLAFIQKMQDDPVLGQQKVFIDYVAGLCESFETPAVRDWRPEQSANRICDFMKSFYNMYVFQWKKCGHSAEDSLTSFLGLMYECLDFGYVELSGRFASLPQDIKDVINKVFFLVNNKIEEWYEERLVSISAA